MDRDEVERRLQTIEEVLDAGGLLVRLARESIERMLEASVLPPLRVAELAEGLANAFQDISEEISEAHLKTRRAGQGPSLAGALTPTR